MGVSPVLALDSIKRDGFGEWKITQLKLGHCEITLLIVS
jgi:hypothetical protein